MKQKQIVILTPLNVMGFSYEREVNEEWLMNRLDIMKKFTAPSLANQSDDNFEWHIQVREETKTFIKQNFDAKINYKICTMQESDQLINYTSDCYDDLLLIRLNSDDCYQKDFIKIVRNFDYTEEKQALVFQKGYMWYQEKDVVVERHFASPPFYAFIYKPEEYRNGFRYDVAGHNHIRKELKTHAFREFLWLWIVHADCNKILRGSEYPDPKEFKEVRKTILRQFGFE